MARPLLAIACCGVAWMWPLVAQATPAAADFSAKVVKACDDVNEWPPYTYFRRFNGQRSQETTGFTVELLKLIGARRGFDVQVNMLPWKRCLESVRQGEHLLVLNAVRTPEREADYWLTTAIYETQLLYLWSTRQHPLGIRLRAQTDLAKYRFGGLQGYVYSQMEQVDMNRMIRAPNYRSLLQMLQLGRVDVVLVNEAVMQGHAALGLAELADEENLQIGAFEDRVPSRFHFMSTRARAEGRALQRLLDTELARMERSGELSKLRAQFVRPLVSKSPAD